MMMPIRPKGEAHHDECAGHNVVDTDGSIIKKGAKIVGCNCADNPSKPSSPQRWPLVLCPKSTRLTLRPEPPLGYNLTVDALHSEMYATIDLRPEDLDRLFVMWAAERGINLKQVAMCCGASERLTNNVESDAIRAVLDSAKGGNWHG